MKTTIPAFLPEITEAQATAIDHESANYSFMIRYAYKRLQEGMAKGSLEKIVSAKTGMTIRHAKDAVEDASELIKARKVLMKDYLTLWDNRYKKTKARFDRLASIPGISFQSRKMKGIVNRLDKQERKVQHYHEHVTKGTFDEVIFGGRKNFEKRSKGELSKQDWWEFRNGRLSSRGDATRKGNPNLRVLEEDGYFYLQITLSDFTMKGKNKYYEKLKLPLYIATKKSKKTGKLNGRNYPELMRKTIESGSAYQVEILKRNGNYYVHIVVNEEEPTLVTHPVNGYKGLDTNPDGLAICYVNSIGNPLSFTWLGDGGLQDYPTNKRENLISILAHRFVKSCVKDGTGAVLEDLTFVQDRQVNAKFHRMSHSFCYRKLLSTIERLCARYGVEYIKVKPAYTSVIGRLKYQLQYDVSVHQSAALVIARRGLGYHEKIPKGLFNLLTPQQKKQIYQKTEFGRWEIIRKRVTALLKKKNAKYYQWLDFRNELMK